MTTPILQALLIADHVYRDTSGKHVICGVFSTVAYRPQVEVQAEEKPIDWDGRKAVEIPAGSVERVGSPFVFIGLSNISGPTTLELRYVDLENYESIFATKLKIDCNDRLTMVQASFPLPPLPTPHEGVYSLELLHEGVLLGAHRVKVVLQK